MKYLIKYATTFLFGILLMGLATNVHAQDKAKAIEAFNKALEFAKSEQYEESINMYNQAIELGKALGEEGNDIVERSQKQLPSIYYQQSLQSYKTFQKEKSLSSLEATISSFQETGDVASEYGNNEIADKTKQVITQLLYNKSLVQFRDKDYTSAMASLDQALERNPNYAKAYYQKGLVVKKMDSGSLDETLKWFDKAAEVGQKNNDNQIVRKANDASRDELVYRGAKAIEAKSFDEAVSLLERALKYDSSFADAYYRLAEAYNKQAMWKEALANANKALEYEKGGKTDKAKIYFEQGTALKGTGSVQGACQAFQNAAFGSFKSPAEHQMEFELKCDSKTG